jgi:D-glycero-D-manno-heptose 1,7-bisphosphate phosphatase
MDGHERGACPGRQASRAADQPATRQSPRRALFLDRDGVINIDRGYVHRAEDFEFVPGIFDLVRYSVHDLGWPVIVVSNQAGIARGLFDESAYFVLTEGMCGRFRAEGAPLAKVYHCPYHETLGVGRYRLDHDWRKPKPGMILQAAADFGLDLSGSVLIGDKISDIEAAAAAGIIERIRIDPRELPQDVAAPSHRVVRDLGAALTLLRAKLRAARRASAAE